MTKKEIIIYNESLLQSVLKDLFTFVMIVFIYWLGKEIIHSNILTVLMIIMFITMFLSYGTKSRHSFNNEKEAIEHIKKFNKK